MPSSAFGRADEWARVAVVAPIDTEVGASDGNAAVVRVKLAHSNQAKIREIGTTIRVTLGEPGELRQMIAAVEGEGDQPFAQHRQHQRRILQMERRLRENGLAREQGLREALSDTDRPLVMTVVAIGERDQEARVGDALHERVKPLRFERSFGPRTLPASRMYGLLVSPAFAFSS